MRWGGEYAIAGETGETTELIRGADDRARGQRSLSATAAIIIVLHVYDRKPAITMSVVGADVARYEAGYGISLVLFRRPAAFADLPFRRRSNQLPPMDRCSFVGPE